MGSQIIGFVNADQKFLPISKCRILYALYLMTNDFDKLVKQSRSIEYHIYEGTGALDPDMQQLLQEAMLASATAHAPYSHFCVGAALLLEDGSIVRGSNQENAAYPSGLCAERVAFFSAGSQHHGKKIVKAAVIAHPAGKEDRLVAASPCAACLQVMLEYETIQQQPIPFLFVGEPGKYYMLDSVADFLPFGFGAEDLIAAGR